MNISKLKGIIPDSVIAKIPEIMDKYEINTAYRLAHFIGNCYHETGSFKVSEENLNYSADRLLVVFPKYFKGIDTTPYARNPQKIANRIYANRMGNGNEASNDGFNYRGRGFIQLTGKDNYSAFSKYCGIDCVKNPDLVKGELALESAAWFWKMAKCNQASDGGVDNTTITKVRKIVNGGSIGLDDVIVQVNKFYNLIK